MNEPELRKADLVGFTSMFTQNLASVALARRLKAHRPSIVTVLGGANCESPMGEEYARKLDPIDFVFSGPGLKSFPAFLRHLVDGEPDFDPIRRDPAFRSLTDEVPR